MLPLLLSWLALSLTPADTQHASLHQWPGLWGASRDGNAASGVPARPTGLREVWRRRTAGGYAEVIVGPGVLYTMEKHGTNDTVVALDPESGRERWRTTIGPSYAGHDGSHDGPIATPSLDGQQIFAMGPHGVLLALDAETGREQWRHDLVREFQAPPPLYGFGTSPLVVGNVVVTQIGGEQGGLLAFNRTTGALAWRGAHSKSRGYASPVLATIAGVRQIVASAGDRAFGVNPETGALLWSHDGPNVNAEVSNPPMVLPDNRVLIAYWDQTVLLRLASEAGRVTATEVWRTPRLRNSYGPIVHRDGFLYGFAGAFLTCVDAATGNIRWRERFYEGALVGAGDHLIVLGQSSGDLHLLRASPDKFAEISRLTVFTPGATSITGPSVVGRRVYIRNVEEMVALEIQGQ